MMSHSQYSNEIEAINDLTFKAWSDAFGHIFEFSPWVVERAKAFAPFSSVKAIHTAFEAVLFGSSIDAQINLIRAHPDLAAKLDKLEKLTPDSRKEQSRAGFSNLSEDVLDELRASLKTYRETFGHPFILCVTEHAAEDVLPIIHTRLMASSEAERIASLCQISRIGWYRLLSTIEGMKEIIE